MNDVETDPVEQPAGEDLPSARAHGRRAAIGPAFLERVAAREREAGS